MSFRFEHTVDASGTEIRLYGPGGSVPTDLWAVEAPAELLPGVDLAQRLTAAGSAIVDGDVLLVGHDAISGLSIRESLALGLGAPAEVRAVVEGRGLITRPDFSASIRWERANGQPVVGAERVGAWIRIGDTIRRLPSTLFNIGEAVERLNAISKDDEGLRLTAIAALRDALPPAATAGEAEAKGLLGQVTIVQAHAFSLDFEGDGDTARLVPILHSTGDDSAPLLAEDQQDAFGADLFYRFGSARSVYTLGRGVLVVLAPPLRRALDVVRAIAAQSPAKRRALLASPRAWLRDSLGDDVDTTVLEDVFLETPRWSDRVLGLGLWQPRVLPWVPLGGLDWFGPEAGRADRSGMPQPQGVVVDGRPVPLSAQEARSLQARIEDAIGAARPSVPLEVDGSLVQIPATHDTLAMLQKLEAAGVRPPTSAQSGSRDGVEALLIKDNELEVQADAEFAVRPSPPMTLPCCLATAPKRHQVEGLNWLQRAWSSGQPGALLADDMGLGKTLQGLAFLAWLREGMAAGTIPRAPVMIVAPTGLLENWRAEHNRHLTTPGLGRLLAAYGPGLRDLRTRNGADRPGLATDALAAADWVLTTYETLRDYDRDFGLVRFAALLFDEAQKIKTPGIRMTDAAKAMNADFRVALTGTPVENRLSDLWCIVDAVHPGCLGDLKTFSARFEPSPDEEQLKLLKRSIDSGTPSRPPLMLRRLKEDQLPDLPARTDSVVEEPMPSAQAEAYSAVVARARGDGRRGSVLEALQRLRALCLHPGSDLAADDGAFIQASARLHATFRALDDIEARGERALVFLDDLDLQARLAGIIQRRYRLLFPPMIINGQVAGQMRQARVDRFQAGPDGFDVMLLSPRAGGVGLTLTRANHVIHLARWWNPAVEDQCTGRVLRIGQTRPVTVHLPIAILPGGRRSFDQNLHALLERKRRLMRDALVPPVATDADADELFSATVGT